MTLTASEPRVGYVAEKRRWTGEDYLAWEMTQAERHEYLRGEVFAMTGGRDVNNTVAGNLYLALREHLAGSPCRVYLGDVKLQVAAADAYYYPDLMVTCSAADLADRQVKREPVLLVEVLSPTTAAFDRGDKFTDYRLLPSLAEVLLVDVDRRRSELFRKGADGLWVLHPAGPEDTIRLASLDLDIPPARLWADLEPIGAESPAPPPAA